MLTEEVHRYKKIIIANTTTVYFALVDIEDYDRLNQYNWYPQKHKSGIVYAARSYGPRQSRITVLMHRDVLGLIESDCILVDHRDSNGLNNQRSNLRIATKPQNAANAQKSEGCYSSYKGVTWNKDMKKWVSRIMVVGVSNNLGYYDDEVEAAKAYDAQALIIHGEFARLNFAN